MLYRETSILFLVSLYVVTEGSLLKSLDLTWNFDCQCAGLERSVWRLTDDSEGAWE